MKDFLRKVDVLNKFSVAEWLRHPDFLLESNDDCCYICDLSQVVQKHQLWMKVFPRVHPHYAVKCNTDEIVLQFMISMGLGFDCASRYEIQLLLGLGAKADDIIFAHPCKPVSHLTYSAEQNVKRSVFDTKEELDKTKKHFPSAELVLRIKTEDSTAQYRLSEKFGARIEDCPHLIDYARQLGLNVIGISFHVGSNSSSSEPFVRALTDARNLFNYAETVGFNFTLLDIGGGFPGSYKQLPTLEEIGVVVNEVLETHFPVKDFPDLHIISEPGRYYVTSAFNLLTTVIGRRAVENKSCEGLEQSIVYNYHLNEGFFGSLNQSLCDPDHFVINKLDENLETHLSNIWGPTRTNSDVVKTQILLPELQVGDQILWTGMGAYTMALQKSFCDSMPPPIKYVISINSLCEALKSNLSCRSE